MPSSIVHHLKMDWTYLKVFLLISIAGTAWSLPPLTLIPSFPEVVKYVNESHIISCQSTGTQVMWTRPTGEQVTQTKGRIHVEDRWKVRGVNLIFESIEKKDRGDYTCTANVDGKEIRKSFKLVVIKPISFLDTPVVQNASEHQDMLIRCEVDGDPEPKVAWQVKGKAPQSPKHKVMADGLYIRNVSLADRGDYLCRAFQASPIASNIAEQTIALRVHHKPQWPREQSEREGAYGFVAGHVNLSCAAVAEPEPTFEWLKGNRSIQIRGQHAQLFKEPNRSVLQLAVHNSSVFGEYVCRASNTLGTLERVVVLREAARPSIPVAAVRATSPDSITLEFTTTPDQAVGPQSSAPAPLEITGYRVQLKQKDDAQWSDAKIYDFTVDSGPLYVVKGLNADTVYTLKAAARNPAGLGDFGTESNYRTARLAAASTASADGTTSSAPFLPLPATLTAIIVALFAASC